MSHLRLAAALSLALASSVAFAAGQDIDKINGSITAESGQSYGDLSTVNGSIRFGDDSQASDATTVNGSIRGSDGVKARDLTTVNGSIRLGSRARLSGGAQTVNGSIFIDRGGQVGQGVETVNGGIGLVQTEVGGDVETVTGDITVGIGSHVRGGIKVNKRNTNWLPVSFGKKRAPRIVIGPNATVDGALVFEREVHLYIHDSARVGKITGATAVRYSEPTSPQD